MGPLEQLMKAAAGVPAPHDYGNPFCDVVNPMDRGFTMGKAPLPDPGKTPQQFNPAPNAYAINMFGTWGDIRTASLNTAGDKSYLTQLQNYTMKIPGPGAYKVEVASRRAAHSVDGQPADMDGIAPADKSAMNKLMHMRLQQKSYSPVANAQHVALDARAFSRTQ